MVVYSIYFLYVISKDNISFLFIHKGDIGEQGEHGVPGFQGEQLPQGIQ